MRFNQEEKYEIIKLVEESELGVSRTLAELGIHKSTFYNWYNKYLQAISKFVLTAIERL